MTTETDTEFQRSLSPHTIHHDPRLPSQHTLDARQLRLLHRAIDTLAFTAEQYRAPDESCLGCRGGSVHHTCGLEPKVTKQLKALEALGHMERALASLTDPDDPNDGIGNVTEWASRIRDDLLDSGSPLLPRAVSALIDATTSAWQPLMSELIEQQDRFRRGE